MDKNPTATEQQTHSDVQGRMESLTRNISYAMEEIDHLEARLISVLEQPRPIPSEIEPVEELVPLATCIRDESLRVNVIIKRIQDICDRIQL